MLCDRLVQLCVEWLDLEESQLLFDVVQHFVGEPVELNRDLTLVKALHIVRRFKRQSNRGGFAVKRVVRTGYAAVSDLMKISCVVFSEFPEIGTPACYEVVNYFDQDVMDARLVDQTFINAPV